ncbi:MAG: metalloregulator ArsR/SmtB family transcription factor [Yaniella sp.]|nr:metalloregulator ArsR/SmtB family transcription factor [Yaniella sp.]
MKNDDQLSSAFAALADATRRNILQRLREGPVTVSELAAYYPISRPAISQHLAVLEKAGLVQRNRRAQWSECSLTTDGLMDVANWITAQQAVWNERFDRLEEYLEKEKSDE